MNYTLRYKNLTGYYQRFVTSWMVNKFNIDPEEAEFWFPEMVAFLEHRNTKKDRKLLKELEEISEDEQFLNSLFGI